MDTWNLKGELILNCNCTVFCPCVVSLGKHPPTEGYCQAWAGVRIDEGRSGDVDLGGLNVALLLDIPGWMGRGNWTVGAWIDERASDAAFERLVDIFSGKARGTTGLFSILVGKFLGAERAPVTFETEGNRRRLVVPKKIVGEVEPIEGATPGEPVMVSNTGYWMGPDIVIAQATQSRVRAFGRVWDFTGRSAEICAIDWGGAVTVVALASSEGDAPMQWTPQLVTNTRIRRSPYTPRVEEAGVKAYTVYNHTLLPVMFRSLAEDYRHLKDHVQLWDVAGERQVEIRGPDAARLVQLMTPRDLSRAVPGRCLYAPLVDERGGLVNDPVVLKIADDCYWLSIADSDVRLWARGLAYGLDLDVAIEELAVAPLAVQGPKADDLMARVFGEAVRAIRFFRFESLPFRDHPLIVARSGWSKQGGFEIYLDEPALGLELWDALWDAGRDLEVGPGCPNLIERIEGGLLSFGGDMTRENNPFECGLDAYLNLDRPIEFMGRAALERIAEAGPARRMAGLRMDTQSLPLCVNRWPVRFDGAEAGRVTSAAVSPDHGCGVALAMLEHGHWEPGHRVEVETPEGRCMATVSPLPFPPPGE